MVNTTTDQSKVTSPFIDVVKSVQGSVVGVNNYQNYTVNNYSPYYGFGGFGSLGRWERGEPDGFAVVAPLHVGYGGIACAYFPYGEECPPVDERSYVADSDGDGVQSHLPRPGGGICVPIYAGGVSFGFG